MKKTTATVAVIMTALAMVTGCQAKPKEEAVPTTIQETAPEKKVELEEIYTEVKLAYGDQYIPSAEYSEKEIEDIFGISPDSYVTYIGEGPMISVHIDQFILMQAKEGKGKELEKQFNAYRDSQIKDAVQYPMNMPKLEASEVVRHGDYVFFVMLGTPSMEAQEKGEEEALESAKEQNQIAIDIINSYFTA